MKDWPYPRWIAHRGAGRLAPENTLAAFRVGAEHGWRMFECDVKLSADGVPFLLHDATLERTSTGQGIGGKRPWSELALLDGGGWHSPRYAGEPLASLANVARFCLANGCLLNIEIKPTPGAEHETGEGVAQHTARLWARAAVPPLLSSFSTEALRAARAAVPDLPRALLLDALPEGWLDSALELDCVAIVCQHALWDAARVARVHGAGLRALSFTVNDEASAGRLIALGVEGLITDRIDLFRPAG